MTMICGSSLRVGSWRGYFIISREKWGVFENSVSAAAHPLLIGLAFSTQEVARVPAEAHDVALDAIVTETEAILVDRRA